MQFFTRRLTHPRKWFRIAAAAVPAALTAWIFRGILIDTLGVVFGAAIVVFFASPLARFYEKRLSRSFAALAALLTLLGALAAALALLTPVLIREISALARTLPRSLEQLRELLLHLTRSLESYLPGLSLPAPSLGEAALPRLADGAVHIAGSVADVFYRLSLMITLGYFFLCDRERLLIRLELLVPSSVRRTAVRMGSAVCRELRLYLRGQGMIAAVVGLLSAAGLALIGVDSPLVLGLLVGVFNMIPYFGPVLGGIPAVLMALGQGWQTALAVVGVLWLVQQIDSTIISPRIMSSLAGLSPAAVLLSLFVGSGLGGVVGMLMALPAVMTFRTVFRVFVQRHENV